MEISINIGLETKAKHECWVSFLFSLYQNGLWPLHALSMGVVLHMAGKTFQLCFSHITLKMTYKHCLAIFPLINQSAAGSKTWNTQTGIHHFPTAGKSQPVRWTVPWKTCVLHMSPKPLYTICSSEAVFTNFFFNLWKVWNFDCSSAVWPWYHFKIQSWTVLNSSERFYNRQVSCSVPNLIWLARWGIYVM